MARYRKLIGCVLAVAVSVALPAAYTSASYVQDGLVVQWDAIDNEGTGTHNPSATVWKDLKQMLLACATASAESLQRLVDNVEFVNASRHGTVTIENGGTRLVYNGLSGSTAVILR